MEMKKIVFTTLLVALLSLFGYSVITIVPKAFSSPPDLEFSLRDAFYPSKQILNDPDVRVGVRLEKKTVAIGEEFKVVLVVGYVEDQATVVTGTFSEADLDPFEVRSFETRQGRSSSPSNPRSFLVAVYTVQCVTCVPGREYVVPSIPVAIRFSRGGGTTVQASANPSTVSTIFRYHPDLTELRGIKSPEPISHSRILGGILMWSGVVLGGFGIGVGGASMMGWLLKRKKKTENPTWGEFTQALALLKEKFSSEEADLRILVQDLYRAVSIFLYKSRGVDIMADEKPRPSRDGNGDTIERISELCEKSYSITGVSREETVFLFSLCEKIQETGEEKGG